MLIRVYKWRCAHTGRKATSQKLLFWNLSDQLIDGEAEILVLKESNLILVDIATAKKFEKKLSELGGHSGGYELEAWRHALGSEGFDKAQEKLQSIE